MQKIVFHLFGQIGHSRIQQMGAQGGQQDQRGGDALLAINEPGTVGRRMTGDDKAQNVPGELCVDDAGNVMPERGIFGLGPAIIALKRGNGELACAA